MMELFSPAWGRTYVTSLEVILLKKTHLLWLTTCLVVLALAVSGCTTEAPQAQKEPVAMEPSIEEELQPVHPDEDVSYTFNTRFSLANAMERVGMLREVSMPPGEQSMAYSNSIGAIEGTLMKQEYQIKKLEFELAKVLYRDGEISEQQLAEKEAAYNQAVEAFKAFWESFGIAD